MTFRKHLEAATVTLLAILVLAAGVLPACMGDGCCVMKSETTVHTQMPCCDESKIAPHAAVRVLPTTPAAPQIALPAVAIELSSHVILPRIPTHVVASFTPHETDPPLFLLNEQFLI